MKKKRGDFRLEEIHIWYGMSYDKINSGLNYLIKFHAGDTLLNLFGPNLEIMKIDIEIYLVRTWKS